MSFPADNFVRLWVRARARPWTTALDMACRLGYAARGFVYLNVGLIALLAALGVAPKARGAVAAFESWADWKIGIVLLWMTGLGLYCFAGWRALQSVFDADQQGRSLGAWTARLGQAVSGVVYAGLAVSVFGLLDGLEDLREVDDQAATRARIHALMVLPYGEALVFAAGAFVLGCGIGNLVQAARRDFRRRLVCAEPIARRAAMVGRLGYAARGVMFLPAGGFMMLAAVHARSAEAKGAGAALDWLKAQPYGGAILGVTALGLMAFGGFAFVEARYRTMDLGAPSGRGLATTSPTQ
jgi:hypothetical protein